MPKSVTVVGIDTVARVVTLSCSHRLELRRAIRLPAIGDAATCDVCERAPSGDEMKRLDRGDIERLVRRVHAMTGTDRLRLAAELLARGDARTAHPIVQTVADELGAIILFNLDGKGDQL